MLPHPLPPRARRGALALAAALLAAGPAAAQPVPDSGLPAPHLLTLTPPGGKAGTTVEVAFAGTDLDEPEMLQFSHPGIKAEPVLPPPAPPPDPKKPKPPAPPPNPKKPPVVVTKFKITISADTPLGLHDVRLVNKWGVSNPRAFAVGDLVEVMEKEPNNDVDEAQRVALNSTVNGSTANPTDVDYYVFAGKRGQRVVVSCLASSLDSRSHPGVEVYDARDRLLAFNRHYHHSDALTDCTLPEDGDYYVRVFEFTYTQGSPEHFYRLSLSTAPWVDAVFPCTVVPGKSTPVTVYGRNLPGGVPDPTAVVDGRVLEKVTATVTAPADPAAHQRLAFGEHLDPSAAELSGFEYRVRNDAGTSNPFLLTYARAPLVLDNGANDTPEAAQPVPVPCEIAGRVEKRGDRDWYAFTARKGDVLTIEAQGDRLRSPTYLYFRVRTGDNKQDLFESPEGGAEQQVPKFFARTEDPPAYRFTAPADGKYLLLVGSRIGDSLASPRQFYRVRITPEQPDFHLVVMPVANARPDATTLMQGGNQALTVLAFRRDGFAGDIALSAEGLPPGVTCPPQTLGGPVKLGELVLSAAPAVAPWTGEFKVVGTATFRGQKLVREARAATIVWPNPQAQGLPTVTRLDRGVALAVRPGAPYAATATLDKPAVTQGDKAAIKLKLARLWPDFKTPLTVQVRPQELPPGLLVNGNNNTFTLAPDKAEGTLPVVVNPNVPPGTYTIVLRTSAPIPFNKDPAAKQKQPVNVTQPATPVLLTVLPKTVATLALPAPALTAKAGAQADLVVRVTRQFGYDGEFKVEVVLPPSVKGLAAAAAVIPAGKEEARVPVKVAADAAPGNRGDLLVRATALWDGKVPVKHEAKFSVNVVK